MRWELDGASVALERPARTVLVFRMKGRMVPEFVDRFGEALSPYVAQGEQVDLFFDTKEMAGYHPLFRERMTEWHAAVKPQTRSANVYVSSKIIAMAIAIANLATGGLLRSTSNYGAFERAIEDAVRRVTSSA